MKLLNIERNDKSLTIRTLNNTFMKITFLILKQITCYIVYNVYNTLLIHICTETLQQNSLTLCLHITLYTHGLDLMLHSKYTSMPSCIALPLMLLPSSRLTTGTSVEKTKIVRRRSEYAKLQRKRSHGHSVLWYPVHMTFPKMIFSYNVRRFMTTITFHYLILFTVSRIKSLKSVLL